MLVVERGRQEAPSGSLAGLALSQNHSGGGLKQVLTVYLWHALEEVEEAEEKHRENAAQPSDHL